MATIKEHKNKLVGLSANSSDLLANVEKGAPARMPAIGSRTWRELESD
jgi:hypothetical protein